MKAYHNSHDLAYRTPFGAAETASSVTLRMNAPMGSRCTLLVWKNREGHCHEIPMEGTDGVYTATLTMPEEGCVLWYAFAVESPQGERYYYGNNREKLGGEGELYPGIPVPFQITVYTPNATPDWYKYGIAYQIFPDRFARGEDWLRRHEEGRRPEGWKGPRRVLQWDWDDVPFYGRNEKGEITRWPFFGGTLEGIREKLDYLKDLGVTVLYLNPIFEATSNHRYDTADYLRIDPALGDEESFRALARDAHEKGIRIVLDGVFNHTGADSRYFNRLGNYDTVGACQGEESPYYNWFRFHTFPDDYESWWGVGDLPNVEEMEESFRQFIYGDENSVIRHWLREGADGWRLDVADELPDEFIRGIRKAMDETQPDSVLLGEVWEDATNKESYGQLRMYFQGDELHSTMNYPFRTAGLDFMLGRLDAGALKARLMSLKENYPRENFYGALNLIGSHDRERVLTMLGDPPKAESLTDIQRERYRLPADKYGLARCRLKLLSLIQFTMPGLPCIYYGDEAGAEGYADPYNRGTYPWGREDGELLSHYRKITALRREHPVLARGEYEVEAYGSHVYGCCRRDEHEEVRVLVNRGVFEHETVTLPGDAPKSAELLNGAQWYVEGGRLVVKLPPLSAAVLMY